MARGRDKGTYELTGIAKTELDYQNNPHPFGDSPREWQPETARRNAEVDGLLHRACLKYDASRNAN